MKNRKKIKRIVCIVLIACIVLPVLVCVSVRVNVLGGAGECISIAFFEKINLSKVDKIVLVVYGKDRVEIDDFFTVKRTVWQLDVAEYTGIKVPPEGIMELYDGDRLVRSMTFCWDGRIEVYEADDTHILIEPDGTRGKVGVAKISRSVMDKLMQIMEEAQDKQ